MKSDAKRSTVSETQIIRRTPKGGHWRVSNLLVTDVVMVKVMSTAMSFVTVNTHVAGSQNLSVFKNANVMPSAA